MDIDLMDSNMKSFETLIFFGDFVEAMELFRKYGDESYMRIALEVLSHKNDMYERYEDKFILSEKMARSLRMDLLNMRKKYENTGSTIKMLMGKEEDLPLLEIDDLARDNNYYSEKDKCWVERKGSYFSR